jgi:hypothetical protein
MVEIRRLLKDLIMLLQHIAEEDYEMLEIMDLSAIKKDLGPWLIDGYPLYQGS